MFTEKNIEKSKPNSLRLTQPVVWEASVMCCDNCHPLVHLSYHGCNTGCVESDYQNKLKMASENVNSYFRNFFFLFFGHVVRIYILCRKLISHNYKYALINHHLLYFFFRSINKSRVPKPIMVKYFRTFFLFLSTISLPPEIGKHVWRPTTWPLSTFVDLLHHYC